MHTPAHSHDGVQVAALASVAATSPWWRGWLHPASEIASELGPIFALILVAGKVWLMWMEHTGRPLSAVWDRLRTAIFVVLGAIGILAVFAALTHAKAAPLPSGAQQTATRRRTGGDDGGNDGIVVSDAVTDEPPWMVHARALIGAANEDTKAGRQAIGLLFKDGHHPELGARDASSTPWCAAAACAVLERAGFVSPRSLAARSFMKWGQALDTPRVGCVVVLFRGSRAGGLGHVGFYVGETATHVLLAGGNQGDAFCVAKFPKNRVLGYRWPAGWTKTKGAKEGLASVAVQGATAAGGATVALTSDEPTKATAPVGALDSVTAGLEQSQSVAHQLSPYFPKVMMVAGLIALALSAVALFRLYQQSKG